MRSWGPAASFPLVHASALYWGSLSEEIRLALLVRLEHLIIDIQTPTAVRWLALRLLQDIVVHDEQQQQMATIPAYNQRLFHSMALQPQPFEDPPGTAMAVAVSGRRHKNRVDAAETGHIVLFASSIQRENGSRYGQNARDSLDGNVGTTMGCSCVAIFIQISTAVAACIL